jgi:hypothetical protein
MDTDDSNIKTLKDEEIITKSIVSRRSLFLTGVMLLSAAALVVNSRRAAASDSKIPNDQDKGPYKDFDSVDAKGGYGDSKFPSDSD